MSRETSAPVVEKRTLFEGDLLQIGHVTVRPTSSEPGQIEVADLHVLALPLAGVFAKHDGPRQQVVATPNHALFISAGAPYRLSFPGRIGDRCLSLRFGSAALARAAPEAMSRDGFDASRFALHTLLPPAVMLSRSQLWRRLAQGQPDALEAEELGIGLLDAVLRTARLKLAPRRPGAMAPRGAGRRLRHVRRIVEAVHAEPERKWSLSELAALASVSPSHLAHVFRAEMGLPVYGYVARARLAQALDAVLDSDAGFTAIALDSGFASHSHFSAKFRALFGRTPQEVRRGARGVDARMLRRIVRAPEPVAA